MLKNKLIKSVCLLDRFNHFNIFFSSPKICMKSKVFKIFFYLQHSNFFFTRTKWKCNLILTPCIFLSTIWHIWILVHFAPWPLGEKVWSEKIAFLGTDSFFSWNQFHEKFREIGFTKNWVHYPNKRDLFFQSDFFVKKWTRRRERFGLMLAQLSRWQPPQIMSCNED